MSIDGGQGGNRTHTGCNSQRFLSPPCLEIIVIYNLTVDSRGFARTPDDPSLYLWIDAMADDMNSINRWLV